MKRLACGLTALAAIALIRCAAMTSTPSDTGWTTLLDGPEGFDENWDRIGAANWKIVDGVVQADTGEKGKNSFLMTKKPYGDFILRAEFCVRDDANSGIYMRRLARLTRRSRSVAISGCNRRRAW